MISITGATNQYSLQPALLDKHRNTLEWLSQSIVWKTELKIFQRLIDSEAPNLTRTDDKKMVDHFQHLITYYNGEVVDGMRKQLRAHENKLAKMLETNAEWDVQYFREHDDIMTNAQSIGNRIIDIRNELSSWQGKLKMQGE